MEIYTENRENQTHLIYKVNGKIVQVAKLLKVYHRAKPAIKAAKTEQGQFVRQIPESDLYGLWEEIPEPKNTEVKTRTINDFRHYLQEHFEACRLITAVRIGVKDFCLSIKIAKRIWQELYG